jgi:carbamoyl-phosphate synthase large subunit
LKVLVVPGTTEIAREIRESLSFTKGVDIFGAGLNLSLGQSFTYSDYFYLEEVNSLTFLDSLRAIVRDNKINVVVPAHDEVAFQLRNANLSDALILQHPQSVEEIVRSKHRTYCELKDSGFVPIRYFSTSSIDKFPVFVKPDASQGSQGSKKCESMAELINLINLSGEAGDFFSRNVVSEFLPGIEVTVDCFSSKADGLVFWAARERNSLSFGTSIRTKDLGRPEELRQKVQEIQNHLGFSGAWFCQFKQDSVGEFRLLEIASRIAGSSGIRRAQGVNLTQLAMLNMFDNQYIVPELSFVNAISHSRIIVDSFDIRTNLELIVVDFDDTLIIDGRVNAALVALLFEAKNSGIYLWICSRHKGNLEESLNKHRLSSIFDKTIHIQDGSPKSLHLDKRLQTLFIDDSFSERLDCGALDNVSAVEPSAALGLYFGFKSKGNKVV